MGFNSITTATHPPNVNLPSSGQQGTAWLSARKVSVAGGTGPMLSWSGTLKYYQVLYNLSTTCFGHFTWPSSGLYLAYRGLYYITSVSNGRRDLVYNGQVHELNS